VGNGRTDRWGRYRKENWRGFSKKKLLDYLDLLHVNN
jgi:hypothetical protein